MGVLKKWANSVGHYASDNGVNIAKQAVDIAMKVGKSALHAVVPDDFEYYLLSLELLDSSLNREGFISFTVMPEQIIENHSPIQSVTKTHQGIISVFSDTFAPVDLNIAGTFGRKFRLVSQLQDPYDASKLTNFLNMSLGKLGNSLLGGNLSLGVKSGYGLTKVLEHMLKAANQRDATNKPRWLILRNYAFNTAYIVDPISFSFSQNQGNNMMWYYSMNLRAVADYSVNKKKNNWAALGTVAANGIATGLTDIATKMIGL